MLCTWQGGQEAQSGTFGTVRHKQCQVSQRKVTISHNCGHSSDMGEGSPGNSSKLGISSGWAKRSRWPKANKTALLHLVIKPLAQG